MLQISNITQINKLYDDAKNCDAALFAEMRTNIKLRNGDHYNTAAKKLLGNFRDKGVITNDQKIRITKNHVFRITDEYINSILSRNPDTVVVPFNDAELQDMKDAELSNSVLRWIKDTNDWENQRQDFVHEQVVVGEAYSVLTFDYSKGDIVGKDEDGANAQNGRLVIDKRFGFDAKRDPAARTFKESRYIIFDKVIDRDEAVRIVSKFKPDKAQAMSDAEEGDAVTVFDHNTGKYTQENAKVAFREMFIRPCSQYPNGKFVLATKDFVVMSMDLPLGIFPVYQLPFSKITTTPRACSITRVIRPYQVEINRASSKMAEHQITLGDDKVIMRNGGKVSNGGKLAGIRVVKVDGSEPTVMAGRTGAQYLEYVTQEVNGMYQAANVGHLLQDKKGGSDQLSLLYQSMTQRASFVNYVSAYEAWEKNMFADALRLCKNYLTDSHLIKIVGKKEQVNIEEFKRIDDDGYDITVEASNGDIETKYGKIVLTTQILQYAGSSMSPEQIGQLIKNLPYANKDEMFSTLTMNYDTATDMILALDRGEKPTIPVYGDTDFYLKALTSRTVKSDFRYLPPQVQQLYQQCIQQLNMIKSNQMLQMQQAEQGMIPASGFLTTVNSSWKNPATGKVERIKVPSDSMAWLVQKLNQQGAMANQLSQQAPQAQAEIVNNAQQMAAQQSVINPNVPQAQGY